MDFIVPADYRVTSKSGKLDIYLDLAKGLRNPWNRSVTMISIAVGALGIVFKGLEK